MPLSSLLFGGKCSDLTSYFSLAYLAAFLPFVLCVYSILPQKWRRYFLLAASYLFYWFISGTLLVYLLLTTLLIHYFGLWLDRIQRQKKEQLKLVERAQRKAIQQEYLLKQRWVVLFAVVLQIGTLLVLKYSAFFAVNLNSLFSWLNLSLRLQIPTYLLPIGISFFTLQAVSYVIDVYRGLVKADENIGRLALFMSFFPQIVEGPICRYGDTAEQLWTAAPITYSNLTHGLQRLLFGMMKKVVVADRLNPLIEGVFTNYTDYQGGVLAVAAICYTVQLYMDFSGTMDAVIGTAQIFGVTLPENFERPFFSKTIAEFWRRWHITLGTWFKDYIFYPVTMAKPMKKLTSKARKKVGSHYGPMAAGSIALFCVWFCNGLWHGAAWSYIFFGLYHFVLILTGNLIAPLVKWFNQRFHLDSSSFFYQLMQMIRTTILVIIGELFFRATSLHSGLYMFRTIVTDFHFDTFRLDLLSTFRMDALDFFIVGVTLLVVWAVSILNEQGCCIRDTLAQQHRAIRWAVLYGLILFIILFGAYGPGYTPVDPIYANF